MAATTVPTPLFPGYVSAFGLSPLEVTIVFAAYGAAVMCGLALFGRLSDHYGRKPPLAAALVVACVRWQYSWPPKAWDCCWRDAS